MLTRPLHHLRRNVIAYLALSRLALGAGGGYAMAATKTKTITVCADKKTGILHLKTRGDARAGRRASPGTNRDRKALKDCRAPPGSPGRPQPQPGRTYLRLVPYSPVRVSRSSINRLAPIS